MSCLKVTDEHVNWDGINVANGYLDKNGNTMFKITYGKENHPLYVDLGEYNAPFGANQYKRNGEPSMTLSVGNDDRRDAQMVAQVKGIEAMKKAIMEKIVKTSDYKLRSLSTHEMYTASDLERIVSGPITKRQKYDEKTSSHKVFEPEIRVKFKTIRSPTNNLDHIGLVERYDRDAKKGLPLIIHVRKDENGTEKRRRIVPNLAEIDQALPAKSRVNVIAQICHVSFQGVKADDKDRKGSMRVDAICVQHIGDAKLESVQAPPVLDGFDDLVLEDDEIIDGGGEAAVAEQDEEVEDEEEDEEEEDEEEAADSDASAYTKAKTAKTTTTTRTTKKK